MKWYHKMSFHLLNITIHTARILYYLMTGRLDTLQDFVVEVCCELFAAHGTQKTPKPSTLTAGSPPDSPLCLSESTLCTLLSEQQEGPIKKYPQKGCVVRSHTTKHRQDKHKLTRYKCQDCDVELWFPQHFTITLYKTIKCDV